MSARNRGGRPIPKAPLWTCFVLMKITKDMKIAEVLKNFPSSKKVFEKHIPECLKCGGSPAESIQRGATMHGIDPDMLVKELNRAAKPRKKK